MEMTHNTDQPEYLAKFVNGFRFRADDHWTEKNLLRLSPTEFELLLELEPLFLCRISLEGLLQAGKQRPAHLYIARRAIDRLLGVDSVPLAERTLYSWAGIEESLTRRAWLTSLANAIDERGPCAGTRSVFEAQPQLVTQAQGDSAHCQPMGELADWYLPNPPPGNFLLPHLMTCSSLVRIGVRNGVREHFDATSPLHIMKFSGHKDRETVVSYTGEELRTGDAEVWGQLLTLAAPLPLGSRVVVSSRELLQTLGRATGGPAYKALRAEIARLQGARVRVRSSHEAMRGQFREMFPDDPLSTGRAAGPIEVSFQLLGPSSTNGQTWSIALPREVRVAFGPRLSSWFSEREYGELHRLREGDTVKRLYLFYRSHPKPWPFTLDELKNFIGSTMKRDSDLKAALDRAHDRLTHAGIIKSWRYGLTSRRHQLRERAYEVDFAKGRG